MVVITTVLSQGTLDRNKAIFLWALRCALDTTWYDPVYRIKQRLFAIWVGGWAMAREDIQKESIDQSPTGGPSYPYTPEYMLYICVCIVLW